MMGRSGSRDPARARVYREKWRAARIAVGLCGECGGVNACSPQFTKCAGCRARRAAKQRQRRQRLTVAGSDNGELR